MLLLGILAIWPYFSSGALLPARAVGGVLPSEDPPPLGLLPSYFYVNLGEHFNKREAAYSDIAPFQFMDGIGEHESSLPAILDKKQTVWSESAYKHDSVSGLRPKRSAFSLGDTQRYFSQLDRQKRTSSPAVDSVAENPSQWRPQNSPNAPFVTTRGQRVDSAPTSRTYTTPGGSTSELLHSDARSNEIPLADRDSAGYSRRYDYPDDPISFRRRDGLNGRPVDDYQYDPRRLAPRRIIYYANLPEIVNGRPVVGEDPRRVYRPRDRGDAAEYDRYDLGRSIDRSSPKYPRESRYDDPVIRSPPVSLNRDDRYRYRAGVGPGSSYTIIDAERSPVRTPYPQRPYPDPTTISRFNRIPAPYQPSPQPPPGYEIVRRPGGPLENPRSQSGPPSEAYRDYNPRQPAPWSMQIGTRLMVKDDGRQVNSGRRFYVQSQDQQPYSPTSRYPRVEDDPRHRL